jgi:hypothetical protein
LLADVILSMVVVLVTIGNFIDQGMPSAAIVGSIVGKPTRTQGLGRRKYTAYYLTVRTRWGDSPVEVNELVAAAFPLGDSVRVEVSPNRRDWRRVESLTTGTVRTASRDGWFSAIAIIAVLMPFFLRRRWLRFDWGPVLWAAFCVKTFALVIMV